MTPVTARQPLRYFVYISDYKLDMLYDQIPVSLLSRISGEIRIDLKIAGLTLRGNGLSEATRIEKLRAVERYIEKHHHVGSVSEPGQEFFRGKIEMQWGWLIPPDWESLTGRGERISPVVIFRGSQVRGQDVDFVLLGGSRKHVLDLNTKNDPIAEAVEGGGSGSMLNTLLAYLETFVSQMRRFDPKSRAVDIRSNGPWAETAIWAGLYMRMKAAPDQCLDFLAVPYGTAEIELKDGTLHGVIGSPIYVAHGQDG
jgi:hypothetical protein